MDTVSVKTPFGDVRGHRDGGAIAFRRVRYAPAPVGVGRFARPGAPPTWTGILEAIAPGPIPPQSTSRLSMVMGDYPAPQDEDCLHLDIWTPSTGGSAAVLVFLHGGAFMTGGGSMSCYDGATLAARTGLVVVNVSYRLGALGWMPIDGIAPANLGLHDQIAALRWVRHAIGAFGGDPGRVTLAGQSAGGLSIAVMLALKGGRELFDRAILMSAPLGLAPLGAAETTALQRDFLTALDLSFEARGALRDMPVERLLEAQQTLLRRPPTVPGNVAPPFMPAIDDDLIPASPMKAIMQGSGGWSDTIIGWTREEYASFYVGNVQLEEQAGKLAELAFRTRFGARGGEQLDRAIARRAPASMLGALADLRTDETFARPSLELAAAQAAHGRPSFVYRFDWRAPAGKVDACHCIDLPFLFGDFQRWRDARMLAGADENEMQALSDTMQKTFAAFAKGGDPNDAGTPDWPAHDTSKSILLFDRLIGPVPIPVLDIGNSPS